MKISVKTFNKKENIAELVILDLDQFNSLVARMIKEEKTERLNQQMLSDRCGTILKTADYEKMKRNAVASGKLI